MARTVMEAHKSRVAQETNAAKFAAIEQKLDAILAFIQAGQPVTAASLEVTKGAKPEKK